ncbi:MAG: hypothetical protein OXG37_00635 [Actinomycetia bacterium]|nr:hypothetical protein [Actinomycetes bacterium]
MSQESEEGLENEEGLRFLRVSNWESEETDVPTSINIFEVHRRADEVVLVLGYHKPPIGKSEESQATVIASFSMTHLTCATLASELEGVSGAMTSELVKSVLEAQEEIEKEEAGQ